MSKQHDTADPFDHYAGSYEAALQKGLSVSGESSDYFAAARVRWLCRRLSPANRTNHRPTSAMDFGCGTGNSISHLLNELPIEQIVGVDTSAQSLIKAKSRYPEPHCSFLQVEEYEPRGDIDLVFCNGVFHHIPIDQRGAAVDFVFRTLKPGGWFAFWENNPWNPGTRYIMRKIPFDHDAITLSIPESKNLLRRAGFIIQQVDSCFYFPKLLSWLRPLEPCLSALPFGAQYLVLARKPVA